MKRTILLSALILAMLAILLYVGWAEQRNARALAGTYLSNGGLDCYIIQGGTLGTLRVRCLPTSWRGDDGRETVSYSGDILRITFRPQSAPGQKTWGFKEMVTDYQNWKRNRPQDMYFEMRRSATTPGDWDLVQMPMGGGTGAAPLPQPVRSFLHRVDEPRLAEYFRLRGEALPPQGISQPVMPDEARKASLKQAGAVAEEIYARHEADPYVAVLLLDAALGAGRFDTIERVLAGQGARLEDSDDVFLRYYGRQARRQLAGHQASLAGRNAYDAMSALLGDMFVANSRGADLATWLARLPATAPLAVEIMPQWSLRPETQKVMNYLACQTLTKVLRVGSVFDLLQGRRAEALDLLCANYRWAQRLARGGPLIQNLIATAMRTIVQQGLLLYALDGCETEKELRSCWARLEELNSHEQRLTLDDMMAMEGPFNQISSRMNGGPNWNEAFTRVQVADARWALLRAAVAARYRLLTQGAFPKTAGDFAPLLPVLPKDPFAKGAAVRFSSDATTCTLYSVGPDGTDQQAQVEYDPSNGTTSAGDLAICVPRARQYPFPKGGVKARTAEELARQFPRGLPPDPFANTKGKPLGVNTTLPLCVYSYGPDVDEAEDRATGNSVPGGGMMPMPMPGMSPQQSGSSMPVMLPMPAASLAPGASTGQPRPRPDIAYDPTNGTVSRGDLSIEIPAE